MESVDLDMGEIFEEEDMDETDFPTQGPLPDLPEEGQDEEENEERENMEVLARLKDLSKGAAKKVVKRPQPKLDPTRLTGERGIPILPKVFEKVKFKGKGHEAHDLGVTMRCLEHWAHRLFPKMPFDEVLERAEKLGSKKEVQTCVKKMRMDIPVLHEVDGEEEEDNVRRGSDEEQPVEEPRDIDSDAEEVWNDILRQDDEVQGTQINKPSHDASVSSQNVSVISQVGATPKTPVVSASVQDTSQGMTPEQRERMERNKRIAHEKRMARLGLSSPASQSVPRKTVPQTTSQENVSTWKVSHLVVDQSPMSTDSQEDQVQEANPHLQNSQNCLQKSKNDCPGEKQVGGSEMEHENENSALTNENDLTTDQEQKEIDSGREITQTSNQGEVTVHLPTHCADRKSGATLLNRDDSESVSASFKVDEVNGHEELENFIEQSEPLKTKQNSRLKDTEFKDTSSKAILKEVQENGREVEKDFIDDMDDELTTEQLME